LQLCKLCRPHTRCTDISNLPTLDYVVEGLHRLFNWCMWIKAVDLEEVDICGIETLE
jgi:hypothetical protein